MYDFLAFRRMITPIIIQVVFWIGVVLCVIAGIGTIISGFSAYYGGGAQVFQGLLILFLGPLGIRIYCELLIIFFRMNETLTEIKHNTERPAESPEGPFTKGKSVSAS